MAYTRKMAGKVPVLKQDLVFDATPTAGSENAVTSGGVAESVAQQSSNIAPNYTKTTYPANSYVMQGGVLYTNPNAIGTAEDWNPAHWTRTTVAEMAGAVANVMPQDASKDNPLMTAADTERMINAMKPIDAMTLRFEFSKKDYNPNTAGVGATGTWAKVDSPTLNVWDWTKSGTSFASAFANAFVDSDNLVSVIAAGETSSVESFSYMFNNCVSLTSVPLFDTSAATNMGAMFNNCVSLTSIPLFDTSRVENMNSMLRGCVSLTSVPLFDTSAATNIGYMFSGCINVEGGALALYQQASTQATPPSVYANCFQFCGKDTETGAAELAQIPQSWGGLAEG